MTFWKRHQSYIDESRPHGSADFEVKVTDKPGLFVVSVGQPDPTSSNVALASYVNSPTLLDSLLAVPADTKT